MAVPPNYPNAADEADQRLLSRVATETQVRRQRQALREERQRSAPITGRAEEYDTTTGDWLLSTDTGGRVRAQLNSNGAPLGRVHLARAEDAQICEINSPPSEADLSPLIDQINGLSESLTALNGARPVGRDPNTAGNPVLARYPNELINWDGALYVWDVSLGSWVAVGGGGGAPAQLVAGNPNTLGTTPRGGGTDLAINTSDQSLWYWDTTGAEWAALSGGGGGGMTFGPGDPNVASIAPEQNILYYDGVATRAFVPINNAWLPTGSKTFFAGGRQPEVAYSGDLYVDSSGNIFQMRSGSWVLTCGRCDSTPNPDPPPIPPSASCSENCVGTGPAYTCCF
jgi:hypothetical protein